MKVYIGPYFNRWISKVHDRHMEMKYGDKWEDNKDWKDRAWERLENALQSLYNVTINKYLDNKNRKFVVKLHNYDTWGMDSTLAYIILPMLKQLKATKHGSPFVDDEDVPENLRSTSAPPKENEYDTDNNYHERWDWVLNEMIWTFEQKTRDWWEEDYVIEHAEIDFDVERDENGFKPLKWKKEGKYDREGEKAHQARMSNGFRLFGKYYEALWD
jgi:hypothetical protein